MESIHKTQRAPHSCSFCARQKTKCDKATPCQACRSRGQADDCFVEMVKVKGQILTSGQQSSIQPSYSELVEENARLRSISPPGRPGRPEQDLYFCLRSYYRPAGISKSSEIIYPSENCSRVLFLQASKWAWIHSAISPALIRQGPLQLKLNQIRKESPNPSEASWLALFFAYLTTGITFSDNTSLREAGISNDEAALLRENWYNATLYFLHQADFFRILDIRNIQTISILGILCPNFGDLNLSYNLLGCAVQIGKSLGINQDYIHLAGITPNLPSQHRLWWSLVILDWLVFPLGQPHIINNDFMVANPSLSPIPHSDSGSDLHNYQSMMSRIALLLYEFQTTFCGSAEWRNIENQVNSTDGKLVDMMKELRHYPKPYSADASDNITEKSDSSDLSSSNQRRNLLLMVFYYRILVNQMLTKEPCSPISGEFALLRCLKSAHSIIKLCLVLDNVAQLVPIWSIILPLYSAANFLTACSVCCHCEEGQQHSMDITAAIRMFDSMSQNSVLAKCAASKLKQATHI